MANELFTTDKILSALELGGVNELSKTDFKFKFKLESSELTEKGLLLTFFNGKVYKELIVKAELLSSHTIYDDTIFISK